MNSQLLGLEIGATVFFFFVIEGGKIDFGLVWFWFFGYLWGKKKEWMESLIGLDRCGWWLV